jgi:hypothetical protein
MSSLTEVIERSAFRLDIIFEDEAGQIVAPQSARYRIDCETTRQPVLDWLPVEPIAGAVSVAVTADQNAILNDANLYEMRLLTVQANHGTPNQFVDRYRYLVKNVYGFE